MSTEVKLPTEEDVFKTCSTVCYNTDGGAYCGYFRQIQFADSKAAPEIWHRGYSRRSSQTYIIVGTNSIYAHTDVKECDQENLYFDMLDGSLHPVAAGCPDQRRHAHESLCFVCAGPVQHKSSMGPPPANHKNVLISARYTRSLCNCPIPDQIAAIKHHFFEQVVIRYPEPRRVEQVVIYHPEPRRAEPAHDGHHHVIPVNRPKKKITKKRSKRRTPPHLVRRSTRSGKRTTFYH